MLIPASFAGKIIRMSGDVGKAWLDALPGMLHYCEQKWNVKLADPFDLSYNYVAPATNGEVVVKICMTQAGFAAERNALRHYAGSGLCRLIDVDESRRVLLLESLSPAKRLTSAGEDTAILAAAEIMQQMRTFPDPVPGVFPTITDWAAGIASMIAHFAPGTGPFDSHVVQKVDKLFPALINSQRSIYVLHGDLHQENILSHGDGWKAIDPKGVLGEVEIELIPFLINNLAGKSVGQAIDYRVSGFCQLLGLSAARVYAWGLCFTVLAAWWNIEDRLDVSDFDFALIDLFHQRASWP